MTSPQRHLGQVLRDVGLLPRMMGYKPDNCSKALEEVYYVFHDQSVMVVGDAEQHITAGNTIRIH